MMAKIERIVSLRLLRSADTEVVENALGVLKKEGFIFLDLADDKLLRVAPILNAFAAFLL